MSIDIDKFSEAELVDLNHRIVERLRFMRMTKAHVALLDFRLGERVSFQPDGRERVIGIVTRYNKKSVTVITPDGSRWNVAPGLLRSEPTQAEATVVGSNVVSLPRK